jgi:sigma-B regulation protein RsbU (phosphoserine phosphatase)
VGADEEAQQLTVTLAGERYTVNSSRQQVLNLLVSTFENAVEKNNELIETNQELTMAKEQLTLWNEKLEELNGKLDTANRRMIHDLNAAAKVQQSLLPATTPKTERAHFSWKYLPCDELAGDFLNVFPLDDTHIAAFVVDVSGHGVASSLLAVTIGRLLTPQVSSSSLLVRKEHNGEGHRIVPPLEVIQELNRRFPMEEQNGLYFTMTYGILDTQTLEFRHAEAGHPQIVHLSAGGGAPQLIEGAGMAIGWVPDIDCAEHVVQLEAGDRLYLYSDGVPEAMDPDLNQFGNRQLLELIELGKSQPLDNSVSLLLEGVERWGDNGSCLKDDVSILGLEITNGAASTPST